MQAAPTLHVIDGDYGLASLEVECLKSILHAKLCAVPVQVSLINGIKSCFLYKGPCCLKDDGVVIEGYKDIAAHWKKCGTDIDQHLNPKQISSSSAIASLVNLKLKPAVDFTYWVDDVNYEQMTSPWIMKALPFPFNNFYAKRRRAEAVALIESLYPNETDLTVIKDHLYLCASESLSSLSSLLGQSNYFLGEKPSSLDVLVYSHISPLLKMPFPSNNIASLLQTWPNLVHFIKRIDAKYLPDVSQKVKYLAELQSTRQDEEGVSYTGVFIIGFATTTLAIKFALMKGYLI